MKRIWLQRLTTNILQHRVYAVVLAFVSTLAGVVVARVMSGMPVLVGMVGLTASITLTLFGILIAALITLMSGPVIGAIATIAATLPYLTTLLLPVHNASDVSAMSVWVWMGLGVAIVSNILTWVFAVMLRRKTSWTNLIQMAALFGVLVVSVLHLAYPTINDWWGTQLNSLQTYYQQQQQHALAPTAKAKPATATVVVDETASTTPATAALTTVATAPAVGSVSAALPADLAAVDSQAEMTDVVKQFVDGMLVVLVLMNALFQLAMARWWQSIIYSPGSLGHELQHIRLSRLAGGLFMVSLVLSYIGNTVILDIMPIVYVLFGVAGISLVHYAVNRLDSTHTWFWLMLFYMVMFFAMPYSVVLIAMLALFDIWLNIRKRLTKV